MLSIPPGGELGVDCVQSRRIIFVFLAYIFQQRQVWAMVGACPLSLEGT